MSTRIVTIFASVCVILTFFSVAASPIFAQTELEKLQAEIKERQNRLSSIDLEIKKFEQELQKVGAEKGTLQNAIYRLNLERKKVLADIEYTKNKINATDLTINKLNFEIKTIEEKIERNKEAIAEILRQFNKADEETLVELFLRQKNISDFWREIEELETVKETIREKILELNQAKDILVSKHNEKLKEKSSLLSLKEQYDDQQAILAHNKATKAELLSKTKNKEANYQTLLKTKKQAKEKLLSEVRDIESQIQFILDPNTIPKKGTVVFNWPIANPRITQYFGYTKFALSGAYHGSKHNGIDLGAPIGTKIKAPLTGTVRMTGNTDLVPGCYSWGQWVLIDHPNGLSSMFAHLSRISVTPGQKVNTGDIVGYVGSTGYSTGPHLHYTVYVSDGVQVKQFNQFKKVTGCGAALSPFAGIDAYLNPLDYLPSQ